VATSPRGTGTTSVRLDRLSRHVASPICVARGRWNSGQVDGLVRSQFRDHFGDYAALASPSTDFTAAAMPRRGMAATSSRSSAWGDDHLIEELALRRQLIRRRRHARASRWMRAGVTTVLTVVMATTAPPLFRGDCSTGPVAAACTQTGADSFSTTPENLGVLPPTDDPRWPGLGYNPKWPKLGYSPKWLNFWYEPLYNGFQPHAGGSPLLDRRSPGAGPSRSSLQWN